MPDVSNCCLVFVLPFFFPAVLNRNTLRCGRTNSGGSCLQSCGRLVSDIPPAQGPEADETQTRSPLPKHRQSLKDPKSLKFTPVYLAETCQPWWLNTWCMTLAGLCWLIIYDLGLVQLKGERCCSGSLRSKAVRILGGWGASTVAQPVLKYW